MTDTRTIRVYGADWCRDCRRTKQQLDGLEVAYDYIDLEEDESATREAQRISGRMQIPVVVFPDGSHQVEPTNDEVEAKLKELSLL
ncbi:glutaredoxin domain-containing protein [Agrococcus sp. Marseille-Q4369]|uniref:glutaredoxin domain-containing protein n=1 Tax=Agrococcus sp. Marseille-Q4369 TaxID=2810513 RepID=UPI001B8D2424|nr:glutaredoxin domain-containing protein [Agrococcus sp. Marseille-Q4369]QUW19484.1 NrdH-redoxin [Agrococcus sp. Marseille-Q4369]